MILKGARLQNNQEGKRRIDYKFIPAPKTAKDVKGMIDIVYRPAK